MAAWVCGRWRIELVQLDDRPAYRVTCDGRLAGGWKRYPRTPDELAALLRRAGAPDLADFVEVE